MTPRDRFLKMLRGEQTDRVPLHLEALELESTDQHGPAEDARYREVAERVIDEVAYRVSFSTHLNRYMCTPPQFMRVSNVEEKDNGDVLTTTEFDTPGGKLTAVTGRNPKINTVWTVKYPCNSVEEIRKLGSVRWEMPEGVERLDTSNLPSDFDRRGILSSGVSSPFVCVAGAMPFQYFLELCLVEPELMRELSAQCMERSLAVLDVVLADKNIEWMWMGGCEWLTPPMASRRLYEEFVQAYDEPIIRRCHEAGALVHAHCHGRIRESLELKIQRGVDYTEPVEPPPDGDITMAEAKEQADGRISLGGNVEARILDTEDADAVEAATRAAFEGGTFRMALRQTSGPLTKWTERQRVNYHRMLDVWEELGTEKARG